MKFLQQMCKKLEQIQGTSLVLEINMRALQRFARPQMFSVPNTFVLIVLIALLLKYHLLATQNR